MDYGKFIDEKLIFAPKKIQIDETIVYNPSEEQLVDLGYKKIVYTSPPESKDGYQYVSDWEEKAMIIEQVWHLEELPPDEPTAEEIIDILIGGAE